MIVADLDRAAFTASLKTEADFWADTIRRGNISIR
jgi:hypothetical protein